MEEKRAADVTRPERGFLGALRSAAIIGDNLVERLLALAMLSTSSRLSIIGKNSVLDPYKKMPGINQGHVGSANGLS